MDLLNQSENEAMATSDRVTKQPQRKVWTRDEVARLADLFAGQRYELIEGELINKMGQKPPHASIIRRLTEILEKAFPGRASVHYRLRYPIHRASLPNRNPTLCCSIKKVPSFSTDTLAHPTSLS